MNDAGRTIVYELFYKNEELSYQKEARLVVYERKHKLKKYETDYLDIQIGSMESYSEIHEMERY